MKSHEENRKCVCILCMQKTKTMRALNVKTKDALKKYFIPEFDEQNEKFPTVLCTSCYKRTLEADKNSKGKNKENFQIFNYSHLILPKPQTRNVASAICKCTICEKARFKTFNLSKIKVKRCSPKQNAHAKYCKECMTQIKRGVGHNCCKTTKLANITKIITQTKNNFPEQVVSGLLQKFEPSTTINQSGSTLKILEISKNNGRKLQVAVSGHSKALSPLYKPVIKPLTVKDVSTLQVQLNLSEKKAIKMVQILRNKNKAMIGSNIERNIYSSMHYNLDRFYETEFLHFVKENVKYTEAASEPRLTVLCKDILGLLEMIIDERNYDRSKIFIKIGADGGGGFLKVCMNICFLESQTVEKKKNLFKEGGVKKLIIIAIASDVQENYSNMQLICEKLKLNDITELLPYKLIIANDLKMSNIMNGLMSHSSSHPCTWCDIHQKLLFSLGNPRTYASIINSVEQWKLSGGNPLMRKNFNCCYNNPIIKTETDYDILDIFPPPELHLMIGLVNTVFKALEKKYPDVALQWSKVNV